MEEITQNILKQFNGSSLDELAESLPTALTTDAHILKASKYYDEGKLWEAFHHLSLCHSTLLYHRLIHQIYRPRSSTNGYQAQSTEDLCDDFAEKASLKSFPRDVDVLRPKSVEETRRNIELLPSNWTVVQITSENKMSRDPRKWKKINDPLYTPSIFISRCSCGPNPSILIKKINPPKKEDSVRSIIEELELIRGINKVISKDYKNDQERYMLKREEVNNRLRVLVRSMENGWLKYFSCLLTGNLSPNHEKLITKKIQQILSKNHINVTEEQLSLLTLMVTYPPSEGTSTKKTSSFDLSLRAGISLVLNESVRSPSVKNLFPSLQDLQDEFKDILSSCRNPVILVLDKAIVSLPWEMTHALHNQPVTRMPSLPSLVHLYLKHAQKADSLLTKGVDVNNGFFILDPDNNLPRTQERLKDTFVACKWEGVKGERPSHDQFKDAMTNKDVLVYVGHGSGSQYMPSHLVETANCRSLVFLYGCSSASLARRGTVPDPWGVILNYLIASCPCVVGMLWEVMDKDTDLLTREIVRALRGVRGASGSPLEDPPTDIPSIVAKAKPLCSWYLISAALVVYGLPLQVIPSSLDDDL